MVRFICTVIPMQAKQFITTHLDSSQSSCQNGSLPLQKEFSIRNIPQCHHQFVTNRLLIGIFRFHWLVGFHNDAPGQRRLHQSRNGRHLLTAARRQCGERVDHRFVVSRRLAAFHSSTTDAREIGIVVSCATALFQSIEQLEGVLQSPRADQRLGVFQSLVRFLGEIHLFFELTARRGTRLSCR